MSKLFLAIAAVLMVVFAAGVSFAGDYLPYGLHRLLL